MGLRARNASLVGSRLAVPAATFLAAAGLLWKSTTGQALLHAFYAVLMVVAWGRNRDAFQGTAALAGLDLIVLYAGLNAIFLVPPIVTNELAPLFGLRIVIAHQHLLDFLGLALVAASPFLARQAWLAGLALRNLAVSLAVLLGLGGLAWSSLRSGACTGPLLEFAGVAAVATALVQLVLADGKGPYGSVWRSLYAGFAALVPAVTLPLIQDWRPEVAKVTLSLRTAALLPIAAGLFAAGRTPAGAAPVSEGPPPSPPSTRMSA